ncbi:hypothetical protein RNJ44_02642 [Nakaseomyces bracarensis]|uniref:Cell wall protein CWP1 n=1 Tax=Nakaseomyces bracarensis TaxID=273131 RepID=A0ABR4NZU1_9SACH
MKFSTAFSVALIALAKVVVADSQTFGLLSIHSGSSVHLLGAFADNGAIVFKSGSNSLSGTVTDAGKLKFSDNTYAVVGSDGSVKEGSEADATTGFSLTGGRLAYKDSTGFYAVPSGTEYKLSTEDASGSTGIVVSARSATGSTVPDFTPSGSSSGSSAGSSASAATSAAASHTAAAISQITDGQIQATSTIHQQTANGAGKVAAGMGAGAVAAIAMLL